MLFDMNVYLGQFPFRPTPHTNAEALSAHLKRIGVEKALVSSLEGVYYRNVQQGNCRLYEAVRPYQQQFVCAALVNPLYPQWQTDAALCVDGWGFAALKLFPCHHGYRLDDEHGVAVLRWAAEHNVPVVLPIGIEDLRQRHPMDANRLLCPQEVAAAASAVPDATLVLVGGRMSAFAQALRAVHRTAPVYYDFERDDNLAALLSEIGPNNMVFGTGAPLQAAETQLVKLETLAPQPSLDAICWRNAVQILHLEE